MPAKKRTRLDPKLLGKIAKKSGKPEKYVREQISKRANRLSIAAEAAQLLWAKELGIAAANVFRKQQPHVQEQVQAAMQNISPQPKYSTTLAPNQANRGERISDSIGPIIDNLLSDEELCARCKDLLRRPRHFDRVMREATTVLENRIKLLAGINERLNPEPLVNKALNPNPQKALLVVSEEASEQEGIHSICRGIVLAFRHRAHHRLDDMVSRDDALKFCAFIDMILDILSKAKKAVPKPPVV